MPVKSQLKQNIKEIVLTGVNIGDYGKGEFGNKKTRTYFLRISSELDKVEGKIEFRLLNPIY
jgi:threonylcarbamoyladenosine tRNA methylthiotransferase MtaB